MTQSLPASRDPLVPQLSRAQARLIVTEAIAAHFDAVRGRVPEFVDRTFTWAEAWRINRKGIGHDLLRAPLNAALVLPHFMLRISAFGLEKAGRPRSADWLRARQLFLKTDVAREIEWRVWTELLQLPYSDGSRQSSRDGLAEAILRHPQLQGWTAEARAAYQKNMGPEALKGRVHQTLAAFGESRAAANEVASATFSLGAGAAILQQFTPSVLTLGPGLANAIAGALATSNVPAALTGIWLGLVPVKAPFALTAGVTAAVFAGAAAATAVSGSITDPLQRMAGLHEKRLLGLVNAVEAALLGDDAARLVAHDHYAGRIIDLVDWLTAAWRYAPRV